MLSQVERLHVSSSGFIVELLLPSAVDASLSPSEVDLVPCTSSHCLQLFVLQQRQLRWCRSSPY